MKIVIGIRMRTIHSHAQLLHFLFENVIENVYVDISYYR